MRVILPIIGGVIGGTIAFAFGFLAINLPEYQNLISALIAVGATLIAATVAWFAVIRQIDAQKVENRLIYEQAKNELKKLLSKRFQDINTVWEAIDVAIADEQKFQAMRNDLVEALNELGGSLTSPVYDQFMAFLNPLDLKRHDPLLKNFRAIGTKIKTINDININNLRMVRTAFSIIRNDALKYDFEDAEILRPRVGNLPEVYGTVTDLYRDRLRQHF